MPKSFPAQLKFREKGSEIFPGSVKALRKGKRKFSRLSLNFVKKKAKSFSITIDTNRLRGHRRILVVLRHNLPAPPTRGSQCFGWWLKILPFYRWLLNSFLCDLMKNLRYVFFCDILLTFVNSYIYRVKFLTYLPLTVDPIETFSQRAL